MNKKQPIVKRLATHKECKDGTHFDEARWLGYNLCTYGCETCDGFGYVLVYPDGFMVGVQADEGPEKVWHSDENLKLRCCPTCNPRNIVPRNICHWCDERIHSDDPVPFVLGEHYRGNYNNTDRNVVFNGYLCEQCAQTMNDEGNIKLV